MATTNFALRTFPVFKEAARALAEAGMVLQEQTPGKDLSYPVIKPEGINSAFNWLIANGLPAALALVEVILTEKQATLDIAQGVMRSMLDNGDVTLEGAYYAVTRFQSNVSKLSAAKGALLRAMATPSEAGTVTPM